MTCGAPIQVTPLWFYNKIIPFLTRTKNFLSSQALSSHKNFCVTDRSQQYFQLFLADPTEVMHLRPTPKQIYLEKEKYKASYTIQPNTRT